MYEVCMVSISISLFLSKSVCLSKKEEEESRVLLFGILFPLSYSTVRVPLTRAPSCYYYTLHSILSLSLSLFPGIFFVKFTQLHMKSKNLLFSPSTTTVQYKPGVPSL